MNVNQDLDLNCNMLERICHSQDINRNLVQCICQENKFVFNKTKRTFCNERIEYDTPVEFEDIFNMVKNIISAVMPKPEKKIIAIFFLTTEGFYNFSNRLDRLILRTKTHMTLYNNSTNSMKLETLYNHKSKFYLTKIILIDANGEDMIIQLGFSRDHNYIPDRMHTIHHSKIILDKLFE